jgi:hypothetical protein
MGQPEIQPVLESLGIVLVEQERTVKRLSAMQRVDEAQTAQMDSLREQLNAMFAVLEDRLTEIERRLGIESERRFTDFPF